MVNLFAINVGATNVLTEVLKGERIPYANVVFHDGSNPMNMHNMYSVIYNELVFNLLKKQFGDGEAVLFARAAFAGGQRYEFALCTCSI